MITKLLRAISKTAAVIVLVLYVLITRFFEVIHIAYLRFVVRCALILFDDKPEYYDKYVELLEVFTYDSELSIKNNWQRARNRSTHETI